MTETKSSPAICKTCGNETDPWGFGLPIKDALDHRLAEVRNRAEMKTQFDRYRSLHAEEKIQLAMDILWEVCDSWDHDNLEHYPVDLPCLEEYITEIGGKLYEIWWKHS